MQIPGIENIKIEFLRIFKYVKTIQAQGNLHIGREYFNLAITGASSVPRYKVAKLYAALLQQLELTSDTLILPGYIHFITRDHQEF